MAPKVTLKDYAKIIRLQNFEEICLLAEKLRGKTVKMVNSTAVGGWVAEMLHRTVPLFNELGLNKREARELVDLYFEELRASLAVGEQIKLSGFGNFDLRDKNERPGRNPKTGEEIPITARRVVTFRPGQKLKARVEAYAGTGE